METPLETKNKETEKGRKKSPDQRIDEAEEYFAVQTESKQDSKTETPLETNNKGTVKEGKESAIDEAEDHAEAQTQNKQDGKMENKLQVDIECFYCSASLSIGVAHPSQKGMIYNYKRSLYRHYARHFKKEAIQRFSENGECKNFYRPRFRIFYQHYLFEYL